MRRHLSPALIISLIALFVALSGTGYAVSQLPKNSVGARQLKQDAVTSPKVKDGSLLAQDFKAGQLPQGSQGEQGLKGDTGAKGEQGLKGDTGAKGEQGLKGDKGDTGAQGDPGPLLSVLPAGKTLIGAYSYAGHQVTGFRPIYLITYQVPLPTVPLARVITTGGAPTAQCPGTRTNPQAAAGYLCVYEGRNDSNTPLSAFPSDTGLDGHLGATLFAAIPDNTNFGFTGSWAVTASNAVSMTPRESDGASNR